MCHRHPQDARKNQHTHHRSHRPKQTQNDARATAQLHRSCHSPQRRRPDRTRRSFDTIAQNMLWLPAARCPAVNAKLRAADICSSTQNRYCHLRLNLRPTPGATRQHRAPQAHHKVSKGAPPSHRRSLALQQRPPPTHARSAQRTNLSNRSTPRLDPKLRPSQLRQLNSCQTARAPQCRTLPACQQKTSHRTRLCPGGA